MARSSSSRPSEAIEVVAASRGIVTEAATGYSGGQNKLKLKCEDSLTHSHTGTRVFYYYRD
jgi:hypothetical protein